ncbi:MAG: hypothetical protein PHT02_01025 [Tissierellia bacterium]|nr:hypothetical protein [Tissierellia bacterium]
MKFKVRLKIFLLEYYIKMLYIKRWFIPYASWSWFYATCDIHEVIKLKELLLENEIAKLDKKMEKLLLN